MCYLTELLITLCFSMYTKNHATHEITDHKKTPIRAAVASWLSTHAQGHTMRMCTDSIQHTAGSHGSAPALDGGTAGHHLIRVDAARGLLAKELAHNLAHLLHIDMLEGRNA